MAQLLNEAPTVDPYIGKLQRFTLYESHREFIIVGSDEAAVKFRVIRLCRRAMFMEAPKRPIREGPEVFRKIATEDPRVFGVAALNEFLQSIALQSNFSAPLTLLSKGYGIVGFQCFLSCYYLTLITKRDKVADLGNNAIYAVRGTETIPLRGLKFDELDNEALERKGDAAKAAAAAGQDAGIAAAATEGGAEGGGDDKASQGQQNDGDESSTADLSQTELASQSSPFSNPQQAPQPSALLHPSSADRALAPAPAPSLSSTLSSVASALFKKINRSIGLGLSPREIAELRYQSLFHFIDLTKHFLFSYTYDLTHSLQYNMLVMSNKTFPVPPSKDMYAWNHSQTRVLESITSSTTSSFWILPLVHGSIVQRKVEVGGRLLSLYLIARRSRHYAGTRYLKRGVSDCGAVANDVEHEQILYDDAARPSSKGSAAASPPTSASNRSPGSLSSSSNSSTQPLDSSKSWCGTFSSFLQVRGSIPVFWAQESSVTMPKPPIMLPYVDPMYKATEMHFADLMKRYGGPIVVLDLVKQVEKHRREVLVGDEYRTAVEYLNHTMDNDMKIRYCALDYSHIQKDQKSAKGVSVMKAVDEVALWSVNLTGFFCSKPLFRIDNPTPKHPNGEIKPYWDECQPAQSSKVGGAHPSSASLVGLNLGADALPISPTSSSQSPTMASPSKQQNLPKAPAAPSAAVTRDGIYLNPNLGVPTLPMEQRGVMRTNCIDCLDRTNVAQFAAGLVALNQQLVVMGALNAVEMDTDLPFVQVLTEMYSEIGDHIALQYGGSEAHKKVSSTSGGLTSTSQAPSQGKGKEFLTSIRRYYSNAFTDRLKQDAINLFLGYFVPQENQTQLWDLDNDYHLHNFAVQTRSAVNMKLLERELKLDYYTSDEEGGASEALTRQRRTDQGEPKREGAKGAGEKNRRQDQQLKQQQVLVASSSSSGGKGSSDASDSRSLIERGIHKIVKRAARSLSPVAPSRGAQQRSSNNQSTSSALSAESSPSASDTDARSYAVRMHEKRALKVRERCKRQNALCSSWWKIAIQEYLQQRMWMHLGQPSDTILPSRFARLYEPDKLTQFDKHFARPWAVPARTTYFNSKAATLNSDRETSPPTGPVILGLRAPSPDDLAVIGGGIAAFATAAATASVTSPPSSSSSSSSKQLAISQQPSQLTSMYGSSLKGGPPSANKDNGATLAALGGISMINAAIGSTSDAMLTGSSINPVNSLIAPFNAVATSAAAGPIVVDYYLRKIGRTAKTMLSMKTSSSLGSSDAIAGNSHATPKVDIIEGFASQTPLNHHFLGDANYNVGNESEYEQFAAFAANPSLFEETSSQSSLAEFTASLSEVNLQYQDVKGIRELSRSAHISRDIESGPYRGLPQDSSAATVAAVVFEQLDNISSAAERGATEAEGLAMSETALEKSGMDACKETLERSWKELKRESDISKLLLDADNIAGKAAGHLTAPRSLDLYCSFFDRDRVLAESDLECILKEVDGYFSVGGGDNDKQRGGGGAALPSFSARAKRPSNSAAVSSSATAADNSGGGSSARRVSGATSSGRRSSKANAASKQRRAAVPVREGFEEVRDKDLFSRRNNVFVCFNAVGMLDWSDKPKTHRPGQGNNYGENIFS